jgi:hypothetical protein
MRDHRGLRSVLFLLAGALVLTSHLAMAQRPGQPPFDVRVLGGVFTPTGAQRGVFSSAALAGVQGGIRLPALTLTSTFLWARSDDRRPGAARGIDLYQVDWGVEKDSVTRPLVWQLHPFVGGGLGVRIYDSREPRQTPRRTMAGYASVGLLRRVGRLTARIELRDHLSRYGGVTTYEASSLRNDLTVSVAIAQLFR